MMTMPLRVFGATSGPVNLSLSVRHQDVETAGCRQGRWVLELRNLSTRMGFAHLSVPTQELGPLPKRTRGGKAHGNSNLPPSAIYPQPLTAHQAGMLSETLGACFQYRLAPLLLGIVRQLRRRERAAQ